jgi:Phosphoenolpyruvate-protein kinase (PTS system EI component in bacteria)
VTVLTGTGHGDAPPLLARAALLVDDGNGRATLAEELLAEAARLHKRSEEPLEIALVAADAAYALLLRLPAGLRLVGVVSEWEAAEGLNSPVPVISGIPDAREVVPDGELLILDAVRGRVVVAPDALDVARFQEAQRRRPRVLLGAAHVPARTQNGREIAVWARVYSAQDIEEAVAQGADGILIDGPGDLLPEYVGDPEETLARLLTGAELAGGGDTALIAPPEVIDPGMIVALAARCRLRWLLSPNDLPLPLPELRRELVELTALEEDERRTASVPQICAALGAVPELDQPDEALAGFDEVALFPFSDDDYSALTLGTVYNLPRLRVYLSGDPARDEPLPALARAAEAGAYGIIVAPELVAVAKDRIRTLDV